MKEWDVATFIEALEEAYSLAPGDRLLGRGQRWLEVVYRLQRIQVRNDDMAALKNFKELWKLDWIRTQNTDTLHHWELSGSAKINSTS